MKKLPFILLASAIIISSPSLALVKPKGSSFDSRMQAITYNEEDVIQLNCYPGIATHVLFAPDEEIVDIASGYSKGWEFKNRRNNLYLKPKAAKADTNLIVATNKRDYMFYLVLHESVNPEQIPGYDPKVAFRVKIAYPGEEKAKTNAVTEKLRLKDRLAQKNSPRNWRYSMEVGEDSGHIAPEVAYDDGRFTYLKFTNNRKIPASFVMVGKSENLTNSHIEGDMLVIHQVAPQFMLRLGNSVVGVFNEAYGADGISTEKGASVPGIERKVVDMEANGDLNAREK